MTALPSPRLEGRLVLITGVGRRGQVGEAVARAFLANGDHVVLVDRSAEEAEERAADLGGPGGKVFPFAADLADARDVERLADDVRAAHGTSVHAVVHLAGGWMQGAPIAESTDAYWERSIAANLMTAAFTARAFIPAVREARGAFVFFASEAALPGATVGGMAAYAAAKQGVVAVARALAQEEGRHGVRSNALAPGSIRTATNEAAMGEDAAYVERKEVAAAVLWLCSDAASAVTGEVIRLKARRRAAGGRGATGE
jgi:3-oxoacyl-[acyl-carrier protein] reductase